MKIGFNISPLTNENNVRGVGVYTKNLLENLKKDKKIEVIEFTDKLNQKVDLIHYPWFDLFFNTLPIKKICPTVVTIHDVMPLVFSKFYPTGVKGKIKLQLQKLSLKSCSAIITDSQTSKSDIHKFLKIPQQEISVIALAADKKFKKLSSKQKLQVKRKLNLPDKFLLYVGDVNFVKNTPFLIREFLKLRTNNQFADISLVLIGKSFTKKIESFHPELKSLIETKKLIDEEGEKIEALGYLETDDLVGVYNLATAYIQPSLYEGFGLPILEAMAAGCPVISSESGSLKEVGKDAVIYFNPVADGELSSAIVKLLSSDTLRKELINRGLERAKDYSWEETTKQTIEVYAKVLKRS